MRQSRPNRDNLWLTFPEVVPVSTAADDVAAILAAVRRGERDATDRLLAAVYDRLRRLAGQMMARERPGQTLSATALVHEAYLRMLGDGCVWEDRRHFYVAAATAMRRILVERGRRRGRLKHGGGRNRVALGDANPAVEPESVDLVALDEALRRLEKEEPRAAQVVMMRFFAGLSEKDTAEALDVSVRTVWRDWSYARAWLRDAMFERDG